MPENKHFQFSNFEEVFGERQSVYRIKRGIFQIVIIPALIFFLFLGGVIAYRETRDIWVIPVCVLPFFLLFCGLIWQLFSTRRDELAIYENGFTYKSGKNLQACLWSEIKFCHHRELNEQEIGKLEAGVFPLGSVEKKSGEVIEFDHDLPGTPELTRRYNTKKPADKRRPKSKNNI
jgi:hypothetical protein